MLNRCMHCVDGGYTEPVPEASAEPDPSPKLYGDLAGWFHLLTAPAEYAEEAAFYSGQLIEACDRPPRTVLELGSG